MLVQENNVSTSVQWSISNDGHVPRCVIRVNIAQCGEMCIQMQNTNLSIYVPDFEISSPFSLGEFDEDGDDVPPVAGVVSADTVFA